MIAVSSIGGPPRDPRTWSNAPANMIAALEEQGHACHAIDTSCLTAFDKAQMAFGSIMNGHAWRAVSWMEPARKKRARFLEEAAKAAGCERILCTGTLDAPVGSDIPYAIWLDNTFALLQAGATALPYSKATCREIERLERNALQGAQIIMPFSRHVRESVVMDYNVPAQRVRAIGCGTGPLPAFEGKKDFSNGHLLFVAKHLFSSKGGDLVLEALQIIRERRPQTKLVIIGNDEAREKAKGMEGVEVHGYVAREVLNEYFHGASMLVQPMLADPWGQVYLEAMKARAIVVSLNIAALPELTEGGRLGVLVDRPDAGEIAEAVLTTFDQPQKDLDAMTRDAQKRALELHSWEAVGKRAAEALGLATG